MIGHSIGRVVLKTMLLLSKQDFKHKALALSIHSMFLAVPRCGTDSGQLLSNLLSNDHAYLEGSGPQSFYMSLEYRV